MDYFFQLLIFLNIYLILTTSANLLVGHGGMLTLGHASFYGLGAYISALLLINTSLTLIPVIFFTLILTSIIALATGYVITRFKGDFFVLATIGLQALVYSILFNWTEVTNGPSGIANIPRPRLFGMVEIESSWQFAVFSSILGIVTVLLFWRFTLSPFGLAISAVGNNPILLTSKGVNVNKIKLRAFTLSSVFAALSGVVYAAYSGFIDPSSFSINESIFILTALLIGGVRTIWGPLIGAAFVILLPEALNFLGISDSLAANVRMIIYGICIVLFMIYRPQGIIGVKVFT